MNSNVNQSPLLLLLFRFFSDAFLLSFSDILVWSLSRHDHNLKISCLFQIHLKMFRFKWLIKVCLLFSSVIWSQTDCSSLYVLIIFDIFSCFFTNKTTSNHHHHHHYYIENYRKMVLLIHSGMEHVWVKEFNQLFVNYLPHVWCIQPVQGKPFGGNSLVTFVDSAKVRFCCDVCGHGWTSMKGRVAFWFDLFYMYGIVAFKLYGQQCDKCKADRYEEPMWYPEEVVKVW